MQGTEQVSCESFSLCCRVQMVDNYGTRYTVVGDDGSWYMIFLKSGKTKLSIFQDYYSI